MSANNWNLCPKCVDNREKTTIKLSDLYGKISHDEFIQKQQASKTQTEARANRCVFREDWEIGVNAFDGKFSVFYQGRCEDCGFEVRFSFEKKVYPEEP